MRTILVVLALALSGCEGTMPPQKPADTAMLTTSGGPVTTPFGGQVTCRDWACTCQCVKGCFQ